VPNGEAVARGEADIAVQQIPELLPVAGTEVVGPLPREVQKVTSFSAAVLVTSKSREAAGALIEFLTSPKTKAVLEAGGFEVAR
jgi:molybdate transport system substrate-binding protein